MLVDITEAMRECLEQCVKFAISKNAWISSIDYSRDCEVAMEDALELLHDLKGNNQ